MSDKLISVPVFVQDSGETIILKLSPQDAARATTDMKYVTSLIKDVYEKKSLDFISHLDISSVSESSVSDTLSSEIQESNSDSKNVVSEKSLFIWPSKCVYLLLDKYEEWENKFTKGTIRHNKIWESIAEDMRKMNAEYTMTGPQCQSKLNGLKKTYKKILDHNSVSGNERKTWSYFERMHEIFGKSGWANPKATASEAGPSIQEETLSDESFKSNKRCEGRPVKRKMETIVENLISDIKEEKAEKEKKRQAKEILFHDLKDQRERQHQEKMAMMDKLLQAITKK